MARAGKAKSGHTVVLIHGIRTHAQWYPRAEEVFSSIEGVEVEAIKYGRFDLLRFLLPGPWRRGPIDKTERILLPILKDCERRKRPVTVIAHSNGTNVIAQILKRNHAVEIDNLIMCGAVVDTGYDWGAVAHKVKGRIINDYGVKDMWPAVAHSMTWGYGYSGTNGIGSPVDDRMHDTNHSAYFDREFIETYWASFLRDGTFTRPRYGGAEPSSPWWFGLFEVPWKWVILLALVAAAVWAFLFWNGGDAPAQPADAVASGEEPAAGEDAPLYAYYEIGAGGQPTEVEGQLAVMPGQSPLLEAIEEGAILRALSAKQLHFQPNGNSPGTTIEGGQCVQVTAGRRVVLSPEDALDGAWLPVRRVACPTAEERDEIEPFQLGCTRNPSPPSSGELQMALNISNQARTESWLGLAIDELGQREVPGRSANPRIVAYMATARPSFDSDEQPWNSQFVNFVMERAEYAGTDSGRARAWLDWGKDGLDEIGEAVPGMIVVASRAGVPDGGFAGFYLSGYGEGSIRMLAGNVCREVAVVDVPENRILGYRLPSDWVGPAQ